MKPLLIRSAFHFLLKYTGNTVAIRIGVELGGIDARAVRRDQRILLRLALQPEADIGDAVVLNETAVIELPVLVRTGSLAQDRQFAALHDLHEQSGRGPSLRARRGLEDVVHDPRRLGADAA